MVLMHDSNAISYALMYFKPITFVYSAEMKMSTKYQRIAYCAKVLKMPLVNMDDTDCVNNIKTNIVDKKRYKYFIKKYIKISKKSENSWEMLIKYVYSNEKNTQKINN
jgi:hypothetical protein